MTNEEEREAAENELKRVLADIDKLEQQWLDLPEDVRRVNPGLAAWFKEQAPQPRRLADRDAKLVSAVQWFKAEAQEDGLSEDEARAEWEQICRDVHDEVVRERRAQLRDVNGEK